MLREIKHVINHPEEIPEIPPASAAYLYARLNASYLTATGVIDEMRKAGFSEAYIAGFQDGINAACEVVDLMENQKDYRQED